MYNFFKSNKGRDDFLSSTFRGFIFTLFNCFDFKKSLRDNFKASECLVKPISMCDYHTSLYMDVGLALVVMYKYIR